MSSILNAGTPAPEFALHVTPDQKLALSELRGKPVVLAFYPADWSPVCGDQMALYNEILPEFQKRDAELLGISVMASGAMPPSPRIASCTSPAGRFRAQGAVAHQYGAYREADGVTERALFVIDKDGIIRWSYCSPIGVNPGADGILDGA